jgi:predicted acetyltransferase
MIVIRTPGEDDLKAIFRRDDEAFGASDTDEQREIWRGLLDLERFRAAFDGDALVGLAGTHELEITLPGSKVLPLAGTTWVSVAPTHRRQGLLRRLMEHVDADIDERDVPLAGLVASEGGIYERFGYGVATRARHIEIDRRRVEIDQRFRPDGGGVTMFDPLEGIDRMSEIYDRFRRVRVGEVSRSPRWLRMGLTEQPGRRMGAIHADGYAVWTIVEDWNDFDAQHELRLDDLVACTDEAHRALWNVVLSHDLVGPVRGRLVASLDETLPSMLTNPRAVKTTALTDFLWLCPRQIGVVLAGRRYRVDDALVVEVDGERWLIEGGPDGARCTTTARAPDLTTTRAGLGSLLLGGVTATELAAGRRLESDDPVRADVFFGWSPLAHCTTSF